MISNPDLFFFIFLLIDRIHYKASRSEPIIINIPKPVPSMVGQEVPASGSSGWEAISVGAGGVSSVSGSGHRQSVSDKQAVFLQLPDVAPLGM